MSGNQTIKLTPQELRAQSQALEQISEQYRSVLRNTDRVLKRVNSNWSYRLANNFTTKIHSVSKASENLVTMLAQSAEAARSASESFTTVDAQLAKYVGGNSPSSDKGQTNVVNQKKEKDSTQKDKWYTKLFDFFGSFGIIGVTTEFILNGTVGEDEMTTGKSLLDLIGNIAQTGAKIFDGKEIQLLGLQSTVDAIGFRENLAMQFEKFKINSSYNSVNLTGAEKAANNIAAAAKWGGVALTGVSKFIGNYDEYNGDYKNWRMYLETIGETVVSVGTGVLATAAVGAVLGAGASAVVVGTIGTGVVMVANWAVEKISGKNISELVSDTVIDAVQDGVKAIGNGIKSAGKAIASWFK
ncbi:MAG: WXG100 family type VII secretion target [Candidatus Fimenecus sp.]